MKGSVLTMKIKIFKSHLSENDDTNNVESNVNIFIKGKDIIDIKQSISAKTDAKGETPHYFVIITVIYNDKK